MNLVLEEANSRLKVPLSGLARAVTQPVVGAGLGRLCARAQWSRSQ